MSVLAGNSMDDPKPSENNVNLISAQGKDKIMDRLLQSVNMVKDVLQTNLKLRQQVLTMNKQIDKANGDFTHVQEINEELKEKLQTLTNVDQDQSDSLSPSNKSIWNSNNIEDAINNRIAVASELYQLKKEKSILQQRLKDLERENLNIRFIDNNEEVDQEICGTDDFEPVRSVISIEHRSKKRRDCIKHSIENSPFEMIKTTYPGHEHTPTEPRNLQLFLEKLTKIIQIPDRLISRKRVIIKIT